MPGARITAPSRSAFRAVRRLHGASNIASAAADASPHLALAAILAAVHHGITHNLDPGDPVFGNADAGADPCLPKNIFWALSALESSPLLSDYLGAEFARLFVTLKRREADSLFAEVQCVEHEFYL